MFPIQDSIVCRHTPLATYLIIGLNVFVFFLELIMPEEMLKEVFYLFGIVPARFTHPAWAESVGFPIDDYWPLLTSQFLHGGWMHIIGNMWTLWIFGDNVEDRMGPVRFVIFYLLCGLVAGVLEMVIHPDSTLPTVGASGAIAGVLGAYLVLFPHGRVIIMVPILFFPFLFDMAAFFYLGYWFFLQLFSGVLSLGQAGQVGGIAFWAHVGGFVAGILFYRVFLRKDGVYRRFHDDEIGFEKAWSRKRYF